MRFSFLFIFMLLLKPIILHAVVGEVDFTQNLPFTTKIYGDIKLIGNSVLKVNSSINDAGPTRSDDNSSYGRNIVNGIVNEIYVDNDWSDVSTYEANNFAYLQYINIEDPTTIANEGIFNASGSTLSIPLGSEIIYARLYWSGIVHNFSDGSDLESEKDASQSVKMQINTNNYVDINITQIGYNTTEGWTELFTDGANLKYSRYSAYKDVTQYFSNLSFDGSSIDITVANITSTEGWMRNYGNYGAWSLAVVYKNSDLSFKNITLYTGYRNIFTNTVEIDINNFLTPKADAVESKLYVFAIEGEKTEAFGEDYLKASKDDVNGLLFNVTNNNLYPNANTNIFDSTITNDETKNPQITNTMGIDIDTFEIGADGNDTLHPQIIQNSQTSTKIELSSGGDAYTVNALALSTELYVPEFCYDYAYKQNDTSFTEDNDGLKDPELIGTVSVNVPIELTIYIKSLVDPDIDVENFTVNILDINTTQALYIDPTTQLARIGDLSPQDIDATTNDEKSFIKDVTIGNINSNDYFYFYYQLDPQMTTMNMPLNINATYSVTVEGITTDFSLDFGADMQVQLCTDSNFLYTPTSGVFNVTHKNYYNATTQYYNLPTQVVKRASNFQILSLDPINYDTLKPQSTVVALDNIDVAAFHDTDTSCYEQSSAITDRIWFLFENNVSTVNFDNNLDFFLTAKENAAFRVSYNLSTDGNNTLVQLTNNANGTYSINSTELIAGIDTCSQDMDNDGLVNDIPADYCNGELSKDALIECMECIYSFNTKFVCSRDNFSIRPEAFLIKLNDQNQSDSSNKTRIADTVSGATSVTDTLVNLTTGYNYNIEITATNYLDNTPSLGYDKNFLTYIDDKAQYIWEAGNQDLSGCNDTTNHQLGINFVAGSVDTNTSINQVGNYRLNILDTVWTTVDHNPTYMTHHTGAYFLDSYTPDCILNSSITQDKNVTNNETPLNGCNISSDHTNQNNNIIYQDYNITFHPYKFDLNTIVQSVGKDYVTTFSANEYIYMSNLTTSEEMSYHLFGEISARGYNDSNLSNFVSNCYAKDISLDINKSSISGSVAYQYRFHNLDDTNVTLRSISGDLNNTTTQIPLLATDFTKALKGRLNTRLNLNFKRDQSEAKNPESITYYSYNAQCSTATECSFIANSIANEQTSGSKNLSALVLKHYYGRTHAPRYRYTQANNQVSFLYYEVYCEGNSCDKSLLQQNTASKITDDPRWFINENHTSNYGVVGSVTQKGATNVTTTATLGAHQDSTTITYNETRSYPYKATMLLNSSPWLIYNKYNSTKPTNQFEVEFDKTTSSWGGKADTNSTTVSGGAAKTNRRIMW